MTINKIIPGAMLLICLYSCNKKGDDNNGSQMPAETAKDYAQLRVGNSWIYQMYEVDSNNNATLYTPDTDSCYIERDTMIGNKKYYRLVHPHNEIIYLCESGDYIIGLYDNVVFSRTNFTDTFMKTVDTFLGAHVFAKMGDRDLMVTVPAGTFKTSAFQYGYRMYAGPSQGKTLYANTRYAKGIGMVSQQLGVSPYNEPRKERRLLRYHIAIP